MILLSLKNYHISSKIRRQSGSDGMQLTTEVDNKVPLHEKHIKAECGLNQTLVVSGNLANS
jgi:hypothetical protein